MQRSTSADFPICRSPICLPIIDSWSPLTPCCGPQALSGNRVSRFRNARNSRSPISDIPMRQTPMTPVPPHSVLGSHLATSSSGFRGSRIRGTSFFWCRKPRNAEPRYPGSDATCPSDDRWLPLIREIATRDFTGHKPLTSPFPERRKPDLSGFVPPVPPMIDGSR
jgi:hypothetical protein